MDMDKALAELGILRGFIDFVNRQVGVYCDCLRVSLETRFASNGRYRTSSGPPPGASKMASR